MKPINQPCDPRTPLDPVQAAFFWRSKADTLLKVDLSRETDFSKVFDDWPEDGNKPRSPKYLLGKEDDIFIRLPSLGGVAAKIRVKSESDTTGVEFDLSDTGSGHLANLSNGLRLGTASAADQNGHPVIKVIDEEILTFELVVDGNTVGEVADVMVDRAEFASCGIDIFYDNAFGDRATIRQEALTNSKFFDAGDGIYSDYVVDDGNPMKPFIKNAGSNYAHSLQADILHISSHGGEHGNLYDHHRESPFRPNKLIFDPNSDISNSNNWNTDVEWIILAACSQLNEPNGGRTAWEHVLEGNPRKLHGLLGAYKEIGGGVDLRTVYADFWSNLRGDVGFVPPAYALAMTSVTPAQPYAILMRSDNALDDFKDGENLMSQDSDGGGLSYSYLDSSLDDFIGCRRVGESDDEEILRYLDGGKALILANPKPVKGMRVRTARKTKNHDLNQGHAEALGKKLHETPEYQRLTGNVSFSNNSDLSEDEALMLAYNSLIEIIPDQFGHLKLKEVMPLITVLVDRNGQKTEKTTGYLIQFSNEIDEGIEVWGNFVNVLISGNAVENISMRLDDLVESDEPSAKVLQSSKSLGEEKPVLEFEDALKAGLKNMKSGLQIKGEYEILKAKLCYVNLDEVMSSKRKDKGEVRNVAPAWHLVVNPSYAGKGSQRHSKHVWISAETGEFIGSKKY